MLRDDLTRWIDATLECSLYSDYAPNGLQIEGRSEVSRIAVGVSANQALIDDAIAWGADAIVVHHGFFWRNEPRTIVGLRRKRIAALIAADISLYGVHLPLDAHAELGNNTGVLRAMGCTPTARFGGERPQLGWLGDAGGVAATELVERLRAATGREPLWFGAGPREVRTVAVVTGGGAGYFEAAVEAGAELFVTGEPSEMAQGLARELGVHFVAAGHHATERFGIRALGTKLAERFDVEVRYIDVDNPV